MARKVEATDVCGYLEGKTDIPQTARTAIIRHSLMPMMPSESSICHTNLGTTIYYVQLVLEPTRAARVLDIVLSSQKEFVDNVIGLIQEPFGSSDHTPPPWPSE